MRLPCEVAVKSVVPAIRALLAKELTENYGMKQTETGELLGVTQTAVSKYAHQVRGRVLQLDGEEEVRVIIVTTAESLAKGALDRFSLALSICKICRLVRERRLMCKLCKRADPDVNVEECLLCSFSCSGKYP
jgi:predicted transcriptional regulator